MPRPTAVVPAYNEEPRLGFVLDALRGVELLSEIIVVDDGSTDATARVARDCAERDSRIRVLQLPRNGGKSAAMVAGAEAAHNDHLVFLDADLIGLRPQHVVDLCRPVLAGEACMAVALFRRGRTPTDLAHRLAPFLSGQRCLRWSVFQDVPCLRDSGWAVEVALTWHAWTHRLPVAWLDWNGLTHAMRPEKRQAAQGVASHVRMWMQILRYLAAHGVPRRVRRSRIGEAA